MQHKEDYDRLATRSEREKHRKLERREVFYKMNYIYTVALISCSAVTLESVTKSLKVLCPSIRNR
jgi:hypothetical protein